MNLTRSHSAYKKHFNLFRALTRLSAMGFVNFNPSGVVKGLSAKGFSSSSPSGVVKGLSEMGYEEEIRELVVRKFLNGFTRFILVLRFNSWIKMVIFCHKFACALTK